MIKARHPDFLNLVSENGLVELRQAQRSGGVFHKNILRHLLRMAVRLTHRQIGAAIPGCFCPRNLAPVILAAFVAHDHLRKNAVLRRVALNTVSLTIPLSKCTGLCEGFRRDDGRMRALRVILGQLAQIILFPLVNVIVHEFFLQKGVARVFFILQQMRYPVRRPHSAVQARHVAFPQHAGDFR